MTDDLRKFVAPEFVFGVGARSLVGRYAAQMGAGRVFLVTDPGVIEAGWTGQCVDALEAQHIDVTVFDGVTPNPRDVEVMRGAELFRSEGCDFIVAVGGGSPMDCAKGIGAVLAHDVHVSEFEGADMLQHPIPPLICIPTTGGTGADVSQFAIVVDTDRRVKMTLVSKALVPDLSLVDPETLLTADVALSRETGVDALSHAVEALCSSANWAMTDLHAGAAIRLLDRHLASSLTALDDLELRAKVMRASLHAGLAFSNAGLGVVHAMAHALGGRRDIGHGSLNGMLLVPGMSYNLPTVSADRLRLLASTLDLEDVSVDGILDKLDRMLVEVGVAGRLRDVGVDESALPGLAATAAHDPCIATNPRIPSVKDIEDIYATAL